jgi:type I restriction enzyme M protein
VRKTLIWSILEHLRSSGTDLEKASLLVLQLFAWDKLNRTLKKKEIPELISWDKLNRTLKNNGIPEPTSTKIGLEIKDGLSALSKCNQLGRNRAAFEINNRTFQALTDQDLSFIVREIKGASPQVLNYPEIIQACNSFSSGGDGYSATPNEVANFLIKLAKIGRTDTVYCPFDRSPKLAEMSNKISSEIYYIGQADTPLPYLINILEDGSIRVKHGDPIRDPGWMEDGKSKKFDVALVNIPYGVHRRYRRGEIPDSNSVSGVTELKLFGEVVNIRHVLEQTKRTAVVIVPNGFLSRTVAGERQYKEYLLESGKLQAVIGLPPLLLTTTNIGFSILVLSKEGKSGEVLFINASSENFFDEKKGRAFFDGSRRRLKNIDEIFQLFKGRENGDFSRLVTLDECRANDYNLLPERYVPTKEQASVEDILKKNNTVTLEEISEILRPQSLKDEIQEGGIKYYEVAVSDIGEDGYIRQPKKTLELREKRFDKPKKTLQLSDEGFDKTRPLILKPHDIILAVKGSVGKVGFVPSDLKNDTWIANQSFQVIRIKPNEHLNDPTVLFRYLCSQAGQKLLQSLVSGTTVPQLQTRDVRGLPIPVPSSEEQKIISKDHYAVAEIYKQIASLREKAEAIIAKHWAVKSGSQSHLSGYSRS